MRISALIPSSIETLFLDFTMLVASQTPDWTARCCHTVEGISLDQSLCKKASPCVQSSCPGTARCRNTNTCRCGPLQNLPGIWNEDTTGSARVPFASLSQLFSIALVVF